MRHVNTAQFVHLNINLKHFCDMEVFINSLRDFDMSNLMEVSKLTSLNSIKFTGVWWVVVTLSQLTGSFK